MTLSEAKEKYIQTWGTFATCFADCKRKAAFDR